MLRAGIKPYAPQEPSDTIWLEHADLIGGDLGSVALGERLDLCRLMTKLMQPRRLSSRISHHGSCTLAQEGQIQDGCDLVHLRHSALPLRLYVYWL